MQSIFLDQAGGDKVLDSQTQETTLIQHIFGGYLRSQVDISLLLDLKVWFFDRNYYVLIFSKLCCLFVLQYGQIRCMQCHHESYKYENMMDLAVEIQGSLETLEDALAQFTAKEWLDGDNKYKCNRYAFVLFLQY
jgi:ubiquitin carboxyl-terminal hydrolase 36/42